MSNNLSESKTADRVVPSTNEQNAITAGPWRVNSNAGFEDVVLCGGTIIAHANRDLVAHPEITRLIAAAPALLAACEAALAVLGGPDFGTTRMETSRSFYSDANKAIARLRAAIQSATK